MLLRPHIPSQPCVSACCRRTIFISMHLHQVFTPPSQGHDQTSQDTWPKEPVPEAEQKRKFPLRSRKLLPEDERQRAIKEFSATSYKAWKCGLADKEWKDPSRPRNWLQKDTPYPANPSFKPPPPQPDWLRSKLYKDFMADPIKNSVRALSERYNMSLKRVEAILRLKGLEAHWIKTKPLQTGFLFGMEKLLGVRVPPNTHEAMYPEMEAGRTKEEGEIQSKTADTQDQEDGAEMELARQRYQRFFFENVVEGEESIMSSMLQKAKEDAAAAAARRLAEKSAEAMMPRYPGFLGNPPPVHLVKREGRPTIKFIDVGGQFLDVDERKERIKNAERRRAMKNKKQGVAEKANGNASGRRRKRTHR